MNLATFFASLREMPSGCREWTRGKNSKGYGYLRFDGRDLRAHRLAFELENGPIPEGLSVCHRCDNPACCNPKHLFLGSAADNQQDKVAKGRHNPQRGSQNNYAKLNETQAMEIRERRSLGEPVASVAKDFGIHATTVSKVATSATWRHI